MLKYRILVVGMFMILNPLSQNDAILKPMITMVTIEQATRIAFILPRNYVANSPRRVELCIPIQSEIVLQHSLLSY